MNLISRILGFIREKMLILRGITIFGGFHKDLSPLA